MEATDPKVKPQDSAPTSSYFQYPSSRRKSWFPFDLETSEYDVLLLSTSLKLLLFPAYRSTDFEVHRNWLAITYSLPISKWYYDTTSEWTLDYPPFFAYFEKLLSIPASFIDPKIVDLNNLNYNAWSVIAYQRTTVILSELVLGVALIRFIRGSVDPSTQRIISASLFLHPGFLIVDHIHFQYNGFMFGILLWSILMARNGNKLASGVLFAVLLNFKHIYMYLAPAYFVYLLRSFCISPSGQFEIKNFLSLANAVIAVFLVSFGPFIVMGQIPQVLSRLFPFTRGLNHAYWAPNAWALVTAADRVLLRYVSRTGADVAINISGVASTSRGLVGDTIFAVLPTVKPIHTFIITVAFQSIALIKLWFTPTYKSFLTALTLCGYVSYLFGWHVHEKAILLVLVPLSLLAAERHAYFRTFILASVAGVFSLFPLIFTPGESIVKVLYSVLWVLFVYLPLTRRVYEFPRSLSFVIIDTLEKIYLAGFPLLQLFVTLFPILVARRQQQSAAVPIVETCISTADFTCPEPDPHPAGVAAMEFLPLMLTSVYCAVGLVWGFCRLMFVYLNEETTYQGPLSRI
ncbi:glucosyltransferase [Mycena albidolilacea]|uniref:Alpha-1,3-glucosyltransferase n=1 Tax=Mycena albidolilacea TaxID=1033008 RepID=A0AAD7F4E1_9AGAR|nr:glucosyltransferase [Mycena albidolilacea]